MLHFIFKSVNIAQIIKYLILVVKVFWNWYLFKCLSAKKHFYTALFSARMCATLWTLIKNHCICFSRFVLIQFFHTNLSINFYQFACKASHFKTKITLVYSFRLLMDATEGPLSSKIYVLEIDCTFWRLCIVVMFRYSLKGQCSRKKWSLLYKNSRKFQ